jgi:hypothetical protein
LRLERDIWEELMTVGSHWLNNKLFGVALSPVAARLLMQIADSRGEIVVQIPSG